MCNFATPNQIKFIMIQTQNAVIEDSLIDSPSEVHYQLTPSELIEHCVRLGQGVLSDKGALCINTGKFTGRSPLDRFIVKDGLTENTVDWNSINIPFSAEKFDSLEAKVAKYFDGKAVYVRDAIACADKKYQLKVRVFNEYPWSNHFVSNMFLRPTKNELEKFSPDWVIYNAPGFLADAAVDGTRQENFAIVNFTKKTIIIGGTGYTGEIKKGIFSVLNFVLPTERNVLSMHCSANVGEYGDTAVFFGLSGTGKTTLSADPNRNLVGDDEHGWSANGVFNFEGGCYAKTINLSQKYEPEIFNAIKHEAILENIKFVDGTRTPDYTDSSITQNTRVSYPIHHIPNALIPSEAGQPKNIFFLTADAFGVLPPVSKMTKGQAMYHFISGYTAKVAGTEEGVNEPQATFSACFGAPFLPLHPTHYAEMLGKKIDEHKVNMWLINTGWTGGPYGVGNRIKLKYTRAMIQAALEGKLDNVKYVEHKIFGLRMPTVCPEVPAEVLDPKRTWVDKEKYDEMAKDLSVRFNKNFEKFKDKANKEILDAAPKM